MSTKYHHPPYPDTECRICGHFFTPTEEDQHTCPQCERDTVTVTAPNQGDPQAALERLLLLTARHGYTGAWAADPATRAEQAERLALHRWAREAIARACL